MENKGTVVLDWMSRLTWKQQSTVFSALRGPDSLHAPNLKLLVKWLRAATQNNANPGSDYMKAAVLPTLKEIENELTFCSGHYISHLLQGLEIIGYKHVDEGARMLASGYYEGIVRGVFHLEPESEEALDLRLRDNV